jgi:hypothetical protein
VLFRSVTEAAASTEESDLVEDASDEAVEALSEVEEEAPRPARVTNSPVHATSAANKAKVNSLLGIGSSRKN